MTPSVYVSASTLSDFNNAFKNLKPKVTTMGNKVSIVQKGKEVVIPLSLGTSSFGYTR